MPKIVKKKFGEKTFLIREKIPIQVLDWATRQSRRIQSLRLDNGEMDLDNPELIEFNFEFRDELARRMVMEPKITEEYMENEADEDDFDLFMYLEKEIGKRIEKRFAHLKA